MVARGFVFMWKKPLLAVRMNSGNFRLCRNCLAVPLELPQAGGLGTVDPSVSCAPVGLFPCNFQLPEEAPPPLVPGPKDQGLVAGFFTGP
jgi:hypothetical protein